MVEVWIFSGKCVEDNDRDHTLKAQPAIILLLFIFYLPMLQAVLRRLLLLKTVFIRKKLI